MDITTIFTPEDIHATKSYTLSKNISAIQLVVDKNGDTRLGLISQLARGSRIDVCGDGFNDRTIKVRMGNAFFFAFLQDLEPPRAPIRVGAFASEWRNAGRE